MKILVITSPRSRSTYFLEHISSHYNIINNNEKWNYIAHKFCGDTQLKVNVDEIRYNIFQNEFKFSIESTFKNNFVSKLFPRMILLGPYLLDNLKSYNYMILKDLSYYLNIKKFNKIYLLKRNLVEGSCSYAYAAQVQNFTYRDYSLLNDKNNKNFIIDFDTNYHFKFFIFESALLEHLRQYLLKYSIDYTEIDYQDVPAYVSDNFTQGTSKTLETNFDYSKLIINYDEVVVFANKFYLECLESVQNIEFI